METITQKIKTLDDVAAVLNIDLNVTAAAIRALPMNEQDKEYLVHHYNWTKITEALNEGWKADFADDDQAKYYPYAWAEKDENDPAGFGFSYTFTYWTRTHTFVGARLLFKSSELATYAMSQFADTYKRAHLTAD